MGSAFSGAGLTINGVGWTVDDGAAVGPGVDPGARDSVGAGPEAPGAADCERGSQATATRAIARTAPATRSSRRIRRGGAAVIERGRSRRDGRGGNGRSAL